MAAEDPTQFALPATADIRVAADITARCRAALDAAGSVHVDCSAVEWVDGSVLQCLVALNRQLDDVDRSLELEDATDTFKWALKVSGLTEALG